MPDIYNLEIHVAHACNLACESCSHYSNHAHKGLVSLEEAESWMAPWAGRIAPKFFSLLGGEPTVHPQLTQFLRIARKHWPRSTLRIVTNGFFLDRHPDLPAALRDDGNAILNISVHHDSPEYRERMRPVLALAESWTRDYGIRIQVFSSNASWTRRYGGYGAQMEPFDDGDPRSSWENCAAKTCPQIFEGGIWKCAPLAYLGMQHARFGLSDKWAPYLGYRPLEAGCSDADLQAFFAREEESHCSMCAATPRHFALPMPIRMHARAVE
jgi:Radical SAM superfamily